ncbi:MAG: hypothetical protein ABI239_04365 [Aquihabitans sp.]
MTEDEFSTDDRDLSDDPRVQAGVDHLQRAAREAIAATRALLDVAEDLVDDPGSLRDLLGVMSSFGAAATKMARGAGGHAAWQDGGDDDDEGPPVQRIPVS